MQRLRAGELCAGYGGLALAVEEVFGAETAWFSEFEEAPSKILAHHWPGVPNYGDMTKIDWAAIEPVDIISGGTPCQDLSHAGARRGMTEGTRSNLWVNMREAIAIQKPAYVVWENVRGAYSAEADSSLEYCPGCMGDPKDRGPVLRALGRVLGDLSDLGYDCQWRGLRAADVGACHARFRVFVLAAHRDHLRHERARGARGRWLGPAYGDSPATYAEGVGRREGRAEPAGVIRRPHAPISGISAAADAVRGGRSGRARETRRETRQGTTAEWASESFDWQQYERAIRRHERTFGRPAPRPAEPTGRNSGERLSPRFSEWMMILPDGWVTSPAINLTRNERIKACGNGVVPAQATAALRVMLAAFFALDSAA